MSRVRVMVSSTCYDLSAVREAIEKTLTELGFEALLSERTSFPTLPHLTTVENCRRAVRDTADMMILIVGRRSGSVVPDTSSTITNLEYREAMAASIPVLIFVDHDVFSLLQVFRMNPTTDLSGQVDSVKVFEFLEEILAQSRWVTQFTCVQGILDGIRDKSSQLFRYLLDLRRGLEDSPNHAFCDESPRVRDLLVSRPNCWELKLFAEMLLDRLRPLKARIESLRSNGVFLPVVDQLDIPQYAKWIPVRFEEIMRISPILVDAVEKVYPRAMPAQGEPVDLIAVKDVVERIVGACRGAVAWEETQRAAVVEESLCAAHEISKRWGGDIVLDVFQFVEKFRDLVNTPNIAGNHNLELCLQPPKELDSFDELVHRVMSNYFAYS